MMGHDGRHACTLDREGARKRQPQIAALSARIRHRARVGDRVVLRFDGDDETAALVDGFVRDEQRCCGFFGFSTRQEAGQTVLELSAPAGAQDLLDGVLEVFDPALDDTRRLALHDAAGGGCDGGNC